MAQFVHFHSRAITHGAIDMIPTKLNPQNLVSLVLCVSQPYEAAGASHRFYNNQHTLIQRKIHETPLTGFQVMAQFVDFKLLNATALRMAKTP